MKILITGGAGFVGRRFCNYYLSQNAEIFCVDPLAPGTGAKHPDSWADTTNPKFNFYQTDCREFFSNNEIKFDLVIHLAAMVGGRLMIEYMPLVVAEDLAIDSMFFKWASKTRPAKILYFSSSAAYPIQNQKQGHHCALKENMIDFQQTLGMPDLTYGWAKLTGEYLAKLAHANYDLDIACYRPFSGYGEDQDLTYPFPAICQRALPYANEPLPFFEVWGTGNQMRDFIHIDDCVRGVLITQNHISDASAINLSTGKPVSFKQLAQEILSQLNVQAKILGTTSKPEGVFARYGDTAEQRRLNFVPEISLQQGIHRTLEHLKQND